MLMQSWLQEMLQQRNCPRPDRRWLYAYRLELSEYRSLKAVLCEALRVGPMSSLARRDRLFSALFVLYASEWWRREYSGGLWKWSPILESLGINTGLLAPNERTDVVLTGFAYWGLRPSGEGKKYFGAIVAHGGLPLRVIGHGGSRLGAIMGAVLSQAARYRWNEAQVVDAVSDHAHGLPDSLLHREIYELVAQMVMTALKLKQEYHLEGVADPIAALDRASPDWREEFPLAVDDDAAQRLLAGLVREANQASLANSVAAFSVIRVLCPVDEGRYAFQSSIAHPIVLPSDTLSAFFGVHSADDIPRYFNIDVAVNQRVPLTVGRQILGMQNASVSLAAQRCRWMGSDAMNEHLLYLRGSAADLHDGPIAIPGGEALFLEEPLVFADREHQFRFVASGNVRLPDSEAILAIGNNAEIQIKEGGNPAELIGRVELGPRVFRLFRVNSDALIRQFDDEWHVRIGQSIKIASSYVLEGQRLPFNTRPWPVFKGMPRLVRYSDSGARSLVGTASQKLCVAGSDREVHLNAGRGLLDLFVTEGGENLTRLRFAVLDKRAQERFVSAAVPSEGEIHLSRWGVDGIALDSEVRVNGELSSADDDICIRLRAQETPPDQIRLSVRWPGCRYDMQLTMPFPATGGRAFDVDGQAIISGQMLPIRRLAGSRIRIFDLNPNTPKRYEIGLSLMGDSFSGRSAGLDLRVPINLHNGIGEVRLLDLYPEIESLLGFSNELDASVKLTLLISDRPDFWLKIARYDTLLEQHILSVALPQAYLRTVAPEELQRIEVLASPLTISASEPVVLEQEFSEGTATGMWGVINLDAVLAPWLIFPGSASSVQFRPMLFNGGMGKTQGELPEQDVSRCALANAMRIPDQTLRFEAIAAVMEEMVSDFLHPSWLFLNRLWNSFGKLPLCSIDPFKTLAARPDWVVAVLMGSQLPLPDLFDFVHQLKRQLGLVLELASVSAWRSAVKRLREYWIHLVGEDAAKLTFGMVVKERLHGIALEFQSLQLIADLLLFETVGEVGQSLVEIHRRSASDPGMFARELWSGADSILMCHLLRAHANDVRWPEPRFFKEQALPALWDGMDEEVGRKFAPQMKSLFWVATGDFKMSVANAPVICAIWSATNINLEWWLDPGRRSALRRLRTFDTAWFDECYRSTLASCMAFGLLQPIAQHVDPRASSGHVVRRVATGTVSAVREKFRN